MVCRSPRLRSFSLITANRHWEDELPNAIFFRYFLMRKSHMYGKKNMSYWTGRGCVARILLVIVLWYVCCVTFPETTAVYFSHIKKIKYVVWFHIKANDSTILSMSIKNILLGKIIIALKVDTHKIGNIEKISITQVIFELHKLFCNQQKAK